MYAIIETKDDIISLVQIINAEEGFLKYVKNSIVKYDYNFIQNMSYDIFKKNKVFNGGKYLIKHKNKMFFVEKNIQTNKGFIYNNISYEIKIIVEWQLILNKAIINEDNDISCNIINPDPISNKFNENTINHEFNIKDIVSDSNICIIGEELNIKIMLIFNLLDKYSNDIEFMNNTLVITSNETTAAYYKHKYPTIITTHKYDLDLITESLKNKNGALIFDNCLKISGTDTDFEMFLNSNKLFILSMQYPLPINKIYREKFDYILLLAQNQISIQKKIYHHYANIFFSSFDLFTDLMKKYAYDYNCVIMNDNKVYKYKIQNI